MWIALLFVACVDVPHAALHPAGADLYAEVPDVGAAISAYANAPMVKMVSSDGAANIAALTKDVGFDLQSMVGGLLPIADPNRPDDRWWPWSAARKASFSLSGFEAAPATGTEPRELMGWMVCDFTARDAAEQAEKALIAMGGKDPKPAGELTVAGTTTAVLEIGSPFESIATKAWIARLDTRLVLGAGAARPEDYATRSAAATGGLAAAWSAASDTKSLGPVSGVTVLEILSDMDELPAFAADSPMISYAAMFLAPFLSAKGRWRIDLQGDRFLTDGIYEPRGKSVDVLGAFGKAPLAPNAIQFLPPDAVGTWITDVDAAKAEVAIGALFQSSLGAAPIAPPKEGEPRMADGLKSAMAMSLLPFQSLMSPTPRMLLTLEIADATKFQAGLDAWLARAQASLPDLQIERKPYRKVPTIVLGAGKEEPEGAAKGGGGSPFGGVSLEPTRATIAVLPDRVIFASAPSVARNEIKRLQDKADVAPHAATQKVQRPTEAFEVSTMDWGSFLSKVYDGLRGFAPMLGQNLEKPIDLEKLPTSEQIFAPFRPSTSWARRVEGRIRVHSESSFGPETPVALAAIGFLATKAMRQPAATSPEAKPVAPPAEEKATEPLPDAERATTLVSLREMRTAIAVYRSQFGRAPKLATDLLQKTDAFPDGFLKTGKLPTDGWGRELVYSATADGTSYSLRSTGPDGVDQQGAGDDVRLP
ncbi:MAG: type II secretion system protein GspG [Planctomycetota bacterium]|nr:type II secretion system protein GspG [Planctomycetota bacterium]